MLVVAVGFILGTIFGSFVQAAAGRIIKKKSLWKRSCCPFCKTELKWYDLFPVFSFIFLKGKCRFCKKNIPFNDFLVEVVLGLIIAILFYTTLPQDFFFNLNFSLQNILILADLLFKILAIIVFSFVFIIDLKTGLILDIITYPASIIALIYILTIASIRSWTFYQEILSNSFGKYLMPPYSSYLQDSLLRLWTSVGINIISAIIAALIFIFLIIITRGKGMGWGDVKYVFFLGLVLGFPNITIGLFLAFLIGAVFSIVLIIMKKRHFGQTIPFGPFLSLGALISLIWGNQILNWYLNSFKLGY